MNSAKFTSKYWHLYKLLRVNTLLHIVAKKGGCYKLSGTRYTPRSFAGKPRTFYVLKEKVEKI